MLRIVYEVLPIVPLWTVIPPDPVPTDNWRFSCLHHTHIQVSCRYDADDSKICCGADKPYGLLFCVPYHAENEFLRKRLQP